jgi:hypothetical protein
MGMAVFLHLVSLASIPGKPGSLRALLPCIRYPVFDGAKVKSDVNLTPHFRKDAVVYRWEFSWMISI